MHERIKEVRQALGLTQQVFAERIGVKRNTVATYEMGRSEPSSSAISLICREFSINEKWLRTGEGKMFVPTPQNVISALASEYNLDTLDQKIVECYLSLGAAQRKVIKDYLHSLMDAISNDEESTANKVLGDPIPIRGMAIARGGMKMESRVVSAEEEEAALPPPYTGDL